MEIVKSSTLLPAYQDFVTDSDQCLVNCRLKVAVAQCKDTAKGYCLD